MTVSVRQMDESATTLTGPTVIGGVGLPWRRDLDLGRLLIEELASQEWPDNVIVEDLSYSAHRVMHTLEELRPSRLILVGATSRGRDPGEITKYRIDHREDLDDQEVIDRLGESVGGVIDLDHVVVVNRYFGSLPEDTVVIDVEAGDQTFGTGYSDAIDAAIPLILKMIREEIE